jgi:hypothetical protein
MVAADHFETMTKRCTKCDTEKSLDDFPGSKSTRDKKGSWCKSCVNQNTKAYFKTRKGKETLQRNLQRMQEDGYYRFGKGAIPILRQGALKRGLSFTLTAEELEKWWTQTPDACSYCEIGTASYLRLRDFVLHYAGTDFEVLKFRRIFKSPKHARIGWMTIDRIDNGKGYHLDNILKCCWFCNAIKGSLLTDFDMRLIAKRLINRLLERMDN